MCTAQDACVSLVSISLTRLQMIKKFAGAHWPEAKIEFDRWRTSSSQFPPEVWQAADKYHGYQWWASFGDHFVHLCKIAKRLLAQPVSASACEFSWRDVNNVVNKRTCRLGDEKIKKQVNTRAMIKLNDSLNGKLILGNVPNLDDVLEGFVQEAIDSSVGGGDDVPDPEDVTSSDSDEDDEASLDLLSGDVEEEEIGTLGESVNADLEQALMSTF